MAQRSPFRAIVLAALAAAACRGLIGYEDGVAVASAEGDDAGGEGGLAGLSHDGSPLGDAAGDGAAPRPIQTDADSGTTPVDGAVPLVNCVVADGGPRLSCDQLAHTCGPAGADDCCASIAISTQGATFDLNGNPATKARVCDFSLDVYEVTVGRFRRFVNAYSQTMIEAGAGKNPNNPKDIGWTPSDTSALDDARDVLQGWLKYNPFHTWTDDAGTPGQADDHESLPINGVNWFEAKAFCIWDGGRLPTDAEWYYAASGGEGRKYPWGPDAPDATRAIYNCLHNGSGPGTCAPSGVTNIARVGSLDLGRGKFTHADLAGNLREWLEDWYYCDTPFCDNCACAGSGQRMVRGGAFNIEPTELQTASYHGGDTTPHSGVAGIRCAR